MNMVIIFVRFFVCFFFCLEYDLCFPDIEKPFLEVNYDLTAIW